jgi:hypothetical protein
MSRGSDRSVVVLSWAVLALLAAHDVTHLADDGLDTSPGQLALVAIPQWLALAAVMVIVLRGRPDQSRAAAIVLGLSVAAGFAVIHMLPPSPAAYWDLEPSGVSWALVWLPAAAGLVLAAIAFRPAVVFPAARSSREQRPG